MDLVGAVLVNALTLSAFLAMIAIGLTPAFGAMRILNFAHGELYMAGAYGVWLLYAEEASQEAVMHTEG